MPELMPQEIEVWDILPAIRRELAKILISRHNLSQKETAKLLGITEPAVSQYMKSKRATEVVFGKKVQKNLLVAADQIIRDRKNMLEQIQGICNSLEVRRIVCDIHRQKSNVSKKCKVCLE